MQYTLSRSQLNQLVEEYQNLRDWTIVRDFCNQVYGEDKILSVTLEIYGEYDDEGGTDYRVQSLLTEPPTAEFDLSLPFWLYLVSEVEADFQGDLSEEELEERALDALKDWWVSYKERDAVDALGYIQWSELPCDIHYDIHTGRAVTYNLTQPPPITYPVLTTEN